MNLIVLSLIIFLYNDQSKSVLSFKTISNFLKSKAHEVSVETKKEMKNVPTGMIDHNLSYHPSICLCLSFLV